jgi:putative transposase
VSRFIDTFRARFGVEPICRTLRVSASAYYQRANGGRSARRLEDERLTQRIREVHRANYGAYGYRRMWRALELSGEDPGRDRVARLMRQAGIHGAKRRGKPWRTTKPDPAAHRRPDLVNRNFTAHAPNELWVADLSYLRCWEGIVFFAFIIDAYSRMIVGWQLAANMRTTLVLDALRMALGTRGPGADVALVHHSDRGSQGGFKWSSQHLIERSCDGQAKGMGVECDGAAGDAFARAAVGGAQGASGVVLGGDRSRRDERGRGGRGRGVGGGWRPVVSRVWRDAAVCDPGSAIGTVSVVRGAGGDRAASRPEAGSA